MAECKLKSERKSEKNSKQLISNNYKLLKKNVIVMLQRCVELVKKSNRVTIQKAYGILSEVFTKMM